MTLAERILAIGAFEVRDMPNGKWRAADMNALIETAERVEKGAKLQGASDRAKSTGRRLERIVNSLEQGDTVRTVKSILGQQEFRAKDWSARPYQPASLRRQA